MAGVTVTKTWLLRSDIAYANVATQIQTDEAAGWTLFGSEASLTAGTVNLLFYKIVSS